MKQTWNDLGKKGKTVNTPVLGHLLGNMVPPTKKRWWSCMQFVEPPMTGPDEPPPALSSCNQSPVYAWAGELWKWKPAVGDNWNAPRFKAHHGQWWPIIVAVITRWTPTYIVIAKRHHSHDSHEFILQTSVMGTKAHLPLSLQWHLPFGWQTWKPFMCCVNQPNIFVSFFLGGVGPSKGL